MTLSLDAMGGDNAPNMVVEGINLAVKDLPQVDFLLFGDEGVLAPLLNKFPAAKAVCQIRHTVDVITNDMQPSIALRGGRNSSMRLAINAVGNGEAQGVVSAGNTGALMAMAKFVLKTLPGIDRPAIATYFPTQRGESVMLDLGANVNCDADNLVQFAVMGEVFARHVLGLKQPSIGILNVGQEELKGNVAVKTAAAILQESDLPIKFYGFVEGDDIGAGTVDVVVTDGFTGNIAIKTAEGTAKLFGAFVKEALMSSPLSRLGAFLAKPALNKFKMRVDPRRYNGAMFLGLNGICVKSHGGTDGFGFSNAIKVAVEMITDGLNEAIKDDFSHLSATSDVSKATAG
ncbi:MAG: phosphate acyltransferase PlsX [Rhodospirillales bacterium]|nr:phosphate acyltransferase PlsX [Rhodospirillales bacterium]